MTSTTTDRADEDLDYEDLDWSGSMGADAAEEQAKSGRKVFRRPGYVQLQDGENQMYRLLNDRTVTPGAANKISWITVMMHIRASTKPKPADYEGDTWPDYMSGVCRADKIFKQRYPEGCPLCKSGHKAKQRVVALVVYREEIKQDDGRVAIVHKMREVPKLDAEGQPVGEEVEMVPDVRICEQSWYGFFDQLAGMSARWGTLADVDIVTGRRGSGKTGTTYVHSAERPIQVTDPDDPSKMITYDLRDPRFWAEFAALGEDLVPDTRKYVAERASDRWYGQWFLEGGEVASPQPQEAKRGSGGGKQGGGQPATPRTEASAEQLAATRAGIMSRVSGGRGGQAPASPDGDIPPY